MNTGESGMTLYNYDACTFWYVDYISIERWKKYPSEHGKLHGLSGEQRKTLIDYHKV